ncbi:MAG TPA: copper chaperone PCu(A)C [Sphingomonas sp.]|nr:copper chaperone PCu(A)C [Sphingomonas sp.]
MKAAFALAASALTLTSCGSPKQVAVEHAWVRLPAVADRPAAAYFELHGGPADTILVGVDSPDAARAEMHESKVENGISSMAPLPQVDLPAGQTVAFAPGGKHVMLFGLNPGIAPGGTVRLHFTFADGRTLDEAVPAIAANAPNPEN